MKLKSSNSSIAVLEFTFNISSTLFHSTSNIEKDSEKFIKTFENGLKFMKKCLI